MEFGKVCGKLEMRVEKVGGELITEFEKRGKSLTGDAREGKGNFLREGDQKVDKRKGTKRWSRERVRKVEVDFDGRGNSGGTSVRRS